ncbi:MAG: glycosyltransferase family protein [Bacteroidota bacterium]
MKIIFTGNYSAGYNRISIILEGLKNLPEITVIEYPIQNKKKCNIQELRSVLKQGDVIFLPSFTHKYVRFIKRHTDKPICFDPLISKYMTKVLDYKLVWKYSPRALKNYYKDKRALSACDFMLADTNTHKEYYAKSFSISRSKIFVLPIGVNTDDFKPHTIKNKNNLITKVGFYGGFIPLQGVSNIIEAARLLSNKPHIQFELVGNGFEYSDMVKKAESYKLQNLAFIDWQDFHKLPDIISSWDICLGIFGNTPKADVVIPNKIFHYAALGKPIISKKTPAIYELFSESSIALCSSQPQEIADTIEYLISDPIKRCQLAENALHVAQSNNHRHIASSFVKILSQGLQMKKQSKI